MRTLHDVVISGRGIITSRGSWAVDNFKLDDYLSTPKTYLDRCSALSLAGCALALRDAGVSWPPAEDEFGIALGTHLGCVETMKGFWDKVLDKGARLANPLLFSHSYFNTPISLCAIEFGLKGYHATFCAGHESGREAVKAACDAIRLGHARAMLCGGVEAITPTRQMCEPSEQPGEAAVFFVLQNASAGQGTPLDEAFFEASAAQRDEARELFGDCGGAQSALELALHLAA